MEQAALREALQVKGFAVLDTGLSPTHITELRVATLAAIAQEDAWRGTTQHVDHGRLLCAALHGAPFLGLVDLPLWNRVASDFFGPNWILNIYTSSCFEPGQKSYIHRIHRDCRIDSGSNLLMLGALIALDDFTPVSGLTHFLPGSHRQPVAPSAAFFQRHAEGLALRAGQALLFDGRVWHAAGANHGSDWRCSLVLGFSDYYLKQRLDIPRLLPEPIAQSLTDTQRRRFGYLHQPPVSYAEYYDEEAYRKRNLNTP
jgi:hypothetical protein